MLWSTLCMLCSHSCSYLCLHVC